MAALDSLLRIVDQQGANELRLGSDKPPSMFAQGAPKKLTMPATSTESLVGLFGELLDTARMALLDKLGRVEFKHDAEKAGSFQVTITKRPGATLAFDAIVMKAAALGAPAPAAAAPALAPPPAPPPHTSEPPIAQAPRGGLPLKLGAPLDAMLARAAAMNASDVHLSEEDVPRARVHGRLTPLGAELHGSLFEIARAAFGPALERRLEALGSFDAAIELPSGGRGRVNVYASSRGLTMAIRLLPRAIPSLGSLGFPLPIDELAELPHGLVLVTGATGSGKSTTLAALAQEALATRSIVLVSLEDPIEYQLSAGPEHGSLVRQRQIGRDVRDFPTGLRDALREDPDVLLIGEMRDAESIQLALTAAETGHLVLASLHARSAVNAVERIIDTYPPERQAQIRIMLADSLRAVVAQRLLPSASGGRVLAAEILRATTSVQAAIRDSKLGAMRSAMQAGKSEGMIVLERVLVDLVRKKQISIDVARTAANDVGTFAQYLST